jgi:hypothetical protein
MNSKEKIIWHQGIPKWEDGSLVRDTGLSIPGERQPPLTPSQAGHVMQATNKGVPKRGAQHVFDRPSEG